MKLLTYEQARQIAEKQIKEWSHSDIELVILESEIIEKWYAWIFSYTSKKFHETGDMTYAIAGNCSLFVSKLNGEIATYSTGYSFESMIKIHEEEYKLWQLHLDHDIFQNPQDLVSLRKCLNLSIAELTRLKSNHLLLIDAGSFNRLSTVQEMLAEFNIKSTIRKSN